MSDLQNKKCIPCEGGTPLLKHKDIEKLSREVGESWKVVDDKKIQKEFVFKDFKEALVFVNTVGALAESEGHHPDIHLFYGKVIIEFWTHAVGGLSENDFILAAKINHIT